MFEFYSREQGNFGPEYWHFLLTTNHAGGWFTDALVTLYPEARTASIQWTISTPGREVLQTESDLQWEDALGLVGWTQEQVDLRVSEYRILDSQED